MTRYRRGRNERYDDRYEDDDRGLIDSLAEDLLVPIIVVVAVVFGGAWLLDHFFGLGVGDWLMARISDLMSSGSEG